MSINIKNNQISLKSMRGLSTLQERGDFIRMTKKYFLSHARVHHKHTYILFLLYFKYVVVEKVVI